MIKKRLGLIHTTTVMALTLPVLCHAQEEAATSAEDKSGLEEVVVTAQKRTSVAQKTPIAISAFSGEALAENGVGSLTDISSIAPNVSFGQQIDQTIVVIRGVSSRDTTFLGDPAVSVSIDGMQLQRSSGLNTTMFDLERVEVLRGPQGTLAGRNATGGAINIITAKPVDDFKASLNGEVGNYNTVNTGGFVNLPINDWLKARVAFQTQDHDGYYDNAPGADGDDEDSKAARLTLAFDPTENLSGLLTAEYSRNKTHGPAYFSKAVNTYTAQNVPPGLLVGDIIMQQPDIDVSSFPIPPGQQWENEVKSVRGTLVYDFDAVTMTYVGGWREMDVDRHTWHGGAFGTNRQNFTFNVEENPRSWTHELRFNGDPDKRFFWQTGAFYFEEKNDLPASDLVDYPVSPGLYGEQVTLFSFPAHNVVAEAKAVFGQVSYELVRDLKLELGGRYTEDSKTSDSSSISMVGLGAYLVSPCGITGRPACTYGATTSHLEGEWSKATYHAALNYQATPHNLHYVKFDTGYKAGGFGAATDPILRPETIEAVEIGSKNRFLADRLQVNLAAFYYEYTDQQINQFITRPDGSPASIRVNAGESEYKGVEMDTVFRLTPNDALDLFVGYTDSKFTDFKAGVSGLPRRIAAAEGNLDAAGNWQLAGRTPPQSPEWNINAGYGHDWLLFNGTLNTRVQLHYESKSFLNAENYDSDKRDAYTKTDLLVSYTPSNEQWQVQGYVRNIEDERVITNSQDASSGTFLSYRYQFAPPRTYGVRVTWNW
jgi:iron complex outermembrane recepter protein